MELFLFDLSSSSLVVFEFIFVSSSLFKYLELPVKACPSESDLGKMFTIRLKLFDISNKVIVKRYHLVNKDRLQKLQFQSKFLIMK